MDNRNLKKNGKIIYVPQKCYAIITPETAENIAGMCTDGLNMCSGVIVKAEKYFVLCHADATTNLGDKQHGIPGWLKQIPMECKKIEIRCDLVEDGYFLKNIKQIINELAKHESREISLVPVDNNQTGVAVMRKNGKIEYSGSITIALEDEEHYDVERSDVSVGLADWVKHIPGLHEPICVFNENELLSLKEVMKRQPLFKKYLGKTIEEPEKKTETYSLPPLKQTFFGKEKEKLKLPPIKLPSTKEEKSAPPKIASTTKLPPLGNKKRY